MTSLKSLLRVHGYNRKWGTPVGPSKASDEARLVERKLLYFGYWQIGWVDGVGVGLVGGREKQSSRILCGLMRGHELRAFVSEDAPLRPAPHPQKGEDVPSHVIVF